MSAVGAFTIHERERVMSDLALLMGTETATLEGDTSFGFTLPATNVLRTKAFDPLAARRSYEDDDDDDDFEDEDFDDDFDDEELDDEDDDFDFDDEDDFEEEDFDDEELDDFEDEAEDALHDTFGGVVRAIAA